MKKIAIVYHSGYGHTKKQAEAVVAGVNSVAGVEAVLYTTAEAEHKFEELKAVDGIIFGSPVYMGSLSADFKKFMELSSKSWYVRDWSGKVAAGFVNSASLNGDKQTAMIQLVTFAAQHGMLWSSLNLLPSNSSKAKPDDLNRMGASLGAYATSDSDLGPDLVPTKGDLDTASHLGKQTAETVLRLK